MATSSAQPDGAKRILAHLEHGARLPASKPARTANWAIDGWTVGLGLLLLAMCAIAWLMHERTSTPSGFTSGYSTSPRHERRQENIQAESAQAETGEVIIEAAELPAAIVNDTALPQTQSSTENGNELLAMTAAMPSSRATGTASADTASMLPAPLAGTSAPGPATSTVAPPRVAPIDATHSKPAAGASLASGNDTIGKYQSNQAGAARAQPATLAASRGKAAATVNDTDVALLTALVAHAGKPAVVAPERSRDIVVRREGDSTADLLARCKQLGLIEGMLCRSRICAGRWESDATCRAPAQ